MHTAAAAAATTALVLAEVQGAVGIVTLNRPERHNALDLTLATSLLQALQTLLADGAVRCVLLQAAGRSFGVGGDVQAFADEAQAAATAAQLLQQLHAVVQAIRASDRVVVCAAQGAVAGGSLSLALACDVGLWASNAKLAPAYARLGASPDCGLTWTLSRALGPQRALEWLLDGSVLTAAQAQGMGLVRHVVEPAALQAQALAMAQQLAALSPAAVARTKQLVAQAGQTALPDQLAAELQGFVHCMGTAPFRDAVRAFVAATASRAQR